MWKVEFVPLILSTFKESEGMDLYNEIMNLTLIIEE